MELIGECKGNNGNGCFMDSCGHDCGCFTIQERSYSEEEVINFTKYMLSKEVTIARSASNLDSYLPKEFQLLSGELEYNGKKILNEWFNEFKNK